MVHTHMQLQVQQALEKAGHLFKQRQFEECEAFLLQLRQDWGYVPVINNSLLQLYTSLKNYSQACEFIQQVRQTHGYQGEYESIYIDVMYLNNDYQGIVDFVNAEYPRECGSHLAESNLPLNKSGVAFEKLGHYDQALSLYQRAIEQRQSDQSVARLNLALLLIKCQRDLEAKPLLEQLLEDNPQDCDLRHEYAGLLLSLGKKKDAVQQFKINAEKTPTYVASLTRLAYTETKQNLGDVVDRLNGLDLNILSQEDKESVYYSLGRAYERMGCIDQALQQYRFANQLVSSRIGSYSHSYFVNRVRELDALSNRLTTKFTDDSTKPNHLFIVGHFRSGSTLIHQILNAHSKVYGAGEISQFNQHLFWGQGNLTEAEVSNICNAYLKLFDYFPIQKKCDLIIDKRPDNILMLGLIKKLLPNAKFIITSRTFSDTALSLFFQHLNKDCAYSNSFSDIKTYHQLLLELTNQWLTQFSDSVILVEYENLVRNLELETKRILDFANLEFENNCLEFQKNQSAIRTASTISVRKNVYSGSINKLEKFRPFLLPGELDLLQ